MSKIQKGYSKFLREYIKGSFCQRTVCIEFGPDEQGKSIQISNSKFNTILRDTKWRPNTLKLPKTAAYDSCFNRELPVNVIRFKHHCLISDQSKVSDLIFRDGDKAEEIQKLKGFTQNGLAQYFLPRLMDKSVSVYSEYVMMRMKWKYFESLWNNRRFDEVLSMAKSLRPDVKIVNVILEGVEQEVNRRRNQRINSYSQGNQGRVDSKCPFEDGKHLKATMMAYYLRDKNLHFTYTATPEKTAEYMIRTTRTLADARFQKLRANGLTITNQRQFCGPGCIFLFVC